MSKKDRELPASTIALRLLVLSAVAVALWAFGKGADHLHMMLGF